MTLLYVTTNRELKEELNYKNVLVFWTKDECKYCVKKKPIFKSDNFYPECKKIIVNVANFDAAYKYKLVPMIEHYQYGVFKSLVDITL